MSRIIIFLIVLAFVSAKVEQSNRHDLSCRGKAHYNVTLAAYYPDFYTDDESDYLDSRGKKLRNLQDFIDGRAEFVTVAMDKISKIKYGSALCVPELNEHFGRRIQLQVRDYSVDLKGKGYSRLDICVRSEADSYDNAVNRHVTIFTSN